LELLLLGRGLPSAQYVQPVRAHREIRTMIRTMLLLLNHQGALRHAQRTSEVIQLQRSPRHRSGHASKAKDLCIRCIENSTLLHVHLLHE
jgi:hypothetical protein